MERHACISKGGHTVVVHCSSDAGAQAEWLLSVVADVLNAKHGAQIEFGWSTLTLLQDGDALVVHEPDFDRDPERDLRRDVTVSLRVQSQMISGARRLGVQPRFARFSQLVAVERGCLTESKLFLMRTTDRFPNDSGWLIFRGKPAPAIEKMPLHRVVSLRPALSPALAFPNDWMISVDGEVIVRVQPPGR